MKAQNIVQVIVVGSREEVALEKAPKDIVNIAEVLTEDPVGLVEAEAEA